MVRIRRIGGGPSRLVRYVDAGLAGRPAAFPDIMIRYFTCLAGGLTLERIGIGHSLDHDALLWDEEAEGQ